MEIKKPDYFEIELTAEEKEALAQAGEVLNKLLEAMRENRCDTVQVGVEELRQFYSVSLITKVADALPELQYTTAILKEEWKS